MPISPLLEGGCHHGVDDEFGPRVAIACRAFDFTLLFEDGVFVMLPAAIFLLLLPWRLRSLWRMPIKLESYRLAVYKLCFLTVLLVCHVLFLAFRLQTPALHTRLSIASGILSIVTIAASGLQSYLEDQHSLNPSDMLVLYLSLSAILSIPRLRSLWIIQSPAEVKAMWTMILIVTAATLAVESASKSSRLRPIYRKATKEQTVGFWSRSFFIWVLPFFQVGYSKLLHPGDIPAVDGDLEEESTLANLDASWQSTNGRHRLIRATFGANAMPFIACILPRLSLAAFTLCQPFLIESSVSYLAASPVKDQGRYGHALMGAFILVYLGIAISRAVYWRYTFRLIARIRCGLIAKIYQHTMALTAIQLKDSAAVTLMGTDVERIVETLRLVHELWASIPEIGIAVWLLARQVSGASVVPLIICIASLSTVSVVAARYGPAQRQWTECVQKRIAVTANMLLDMKAIKMLGLTPVLHEIVSRLREVELQTSERFRSLLVWQIVISNAPEQLAPFATFAAYIIIASVRRDETLFSAQAFTSLSLITLVTRSLLLFCQAVPSCTQAAACFGRIDAYLGLENSANPPASPPSSLPPVESLPDFIPLKQLPPSASSRPTLMCFESADISWSPDAPEPTLCGIDMTIRPGFTGIVGPVASGKSTLLASILGETILNRGVLSPTLSRAAFCSQVPWIMNNTIQYNITGGLAFDQKWYDFSVSSCCLQEDLSTMPRGDQTVAGSNGVSLSGGQRQRLALARAVYSRLPVVILDDVTSGLDPVITGTIISQLFGEGGHFRKAGISVVLATHNRRLLPYMDTIIVLKDGRIVENGSYGEIQQHAPNLIEEVEINSEPGVVSSGEDSVHHEQAEIDNLSLVAGGEEATPEEVTSWKQDGSWSVYKYYYQSAGTSSVLLWTLSTILAAVSDNYAPLWLQRWAAANEKAPNQQLGLYLGVYGLIFIVSTAGMLAECWFFFVRIINDTALKLHDDLLTATLGPICRAPFSFFQKTDTGTITNRFNQDMDLIDMTLPSHAIQFTTGAASCIVQLVILCVLGKYLTGVVPVLAAVLYLVQRYYLRTSRQLRLIDIEAKAPLYKHFIETTRGASTIRAFGWASTFCEHQGQMLNQSQRPFYMLFCIQQWLTLVLDLIVGTLAVILVAMATSLTDTFGPGGLGVALVLLISSSSLLTQTIQAWTRMETSIGAVARVQQFLKNTPSEAAGDMLPPPNWPSRGAILFDNVTASYASDGPPSLVNMTLSIAPGEKIAVCGTSGSGKTSLIMAMLQMMDLEAGCITIDDRDVSMLRGHDVRSRINVISQDPFFLPGTVKLNINPRSQSSDERIESAIRKVGLWGRVSANGGLDANLDASEWSHGEKQLLCLARALLVPSEVLVLDEATSSVDEETEDAMQGVIDSEFWEQTILSVLHRFTYINRFDRVVVLDRGRLVECDTPQRLMANDSAFRRLYTAQSSPHQ